MAAGYQSPDFALYRQMETGDRKLVKHSLKESKL
jgi:hypothetical protein